MNRYVAGWERISKLLLSCLPVLFWMIAGCAQTGPFAEKEKTPPTTIGPELPLDAAVEMSPGLSVRYVYGFFRNVSQMPSAEVIQEKGAAGKPILGINHRFGRGEVFDSGKSQGVGMEMTGYLRLPQAGAYRLRVNSNDGIRIFLGGSVVVEDPRYHSDRFSESGVLVAEAAGYFPVRILYFQRKGTATLELFWQKPGSETFAVIPVEAYAHKAP